MTRPDTPRPDAPPQAVQGVLLDIEGTVSPLAFVRDEMFPVVRRRLEDFLARHFDADEVRRAADEIAAEEGAADFAALLADRAGGDPSRARAVLAGAVHAQMDRDAKATGLKRLQGLIWREAFADGTLRTTLYEDVRPVLEAWQAAGIDLRVYSSGSVAAQQLFFGHTTDGDATGLFTGFYDTTIGGKRDVASYRRIAVDWGVPAESVLFLSDVPEELAAAKLAGLVVVLVDRPGNAPLPPGTSFPQVTSLREIDLAALFDGT